MSGSLAHDQLPNVATASGRPLLPERRPENPDAIGYVQVTDEIQQVETIQAPANENQTTKTQPVEGQPVEADANGAAAQQVGAGGQMIQGEECEQRAKVLARRRELIGVFIHDLNQHPFANGEDLRKINALGDEVWASKLSKFKTDLFTGLLKRMPGRGTPGEEVCPIHSRIKSQTLLDLFKSVKNETWQDSMGFFDARLENKFVKLLLNVNLVWDEKFFKGKIIGPPNDSLVLFNPYAEHKLFQLKDCAGCYLRRIFSDPRCVFALLAAVEFKLRLNRIPEEEAPNLYWYMEIAWQILADEYPDLWEAVGNPDVARRRVSTDVIALVALAREYERSD
ncbi:hypothetical protein DFP73DRAFT_594371 [Morchella snyderi]|nr:hypothetical protein DFP73DRAFT_594371 [Morchella snyderi]